MKAELKAAEARKAAAFPPVLDACCGSRMFWFDRKDSRAMYVDKRRTTWSRPPCRTHPKGGTIVVDPDMVADFTALPFPDETFWHVVFDPPHFARKGKDTGYLVQTYGWLPDGWRDMLRKGFAECFRVLRPDGTLIFKWAESDYTVREILTLTPERPLYGHQSGKFSKTHWIAFIKPNAASQAPACPIRRKPAP